MKEDCDSTWPLPVESNLAGTLSASPPVFSFYSDASFKMPPELVEEISLPEGVHMAYPHRTHCLPKDRVFGEMVSMIRYPMKINWVQDQPIELYDLSWDTAERSNLAVVQAETAAELRAELETHLRERIMNRDRPSGDEISEETVRALKSLGYIE